MQFDFQDDKLRQLHQESDFRLPSLGNDVIRCFRKVMGAISAAADERDLYKMRSLGFEKLKGRRMGQYSLRLNDQWRLIVQLKDHEQEGGLTKVLMVLEIIDYH